MTERELLTAGLRELDVAECPSAADNLLRYSEILREKNKVMNLTAITDPTEIVTRHFLDCAALDRICRRMDACSMWEREPVFRACRWRFCARRPSLCCLMHCASALIF